MSHTYLHQPHCQAMHILLARNAPAAFFASIAEAEFRQHPARGMVICMVAGDDRLRAETRNSPFEQSACGFRGIAPVPPRLTDPVADFMCAVCMGLEAAAADQPFALNCDGVIELVALCPQLPGLRNPVARHIGCVG